MKKSPIVLLFALITMLSCLQQELVSPESDSDQNILKASVETPANSKVFLNEDNLVLWSADDQIMSFNGTTDACMYTIDEKFVGQTSAQFVYGGSLELENDIERIHKHIAYYPLSFDVECYEEDNVYYLENVLIPSEQPYVKGSVSPDCFPMVAVAEPMSMDLSFKNICGIVKLQLLGDCVVDYITLKGNSSERLAGYGDLYLEGDFKSPVLEDCSSRSVDVYCNKKMVRLNTETPTVFMFAVSPTEFEKGFTVTVADINGNKYELTTTKHQSVKRSTILRMPTASIYDEVLRPEKATIALHEVGPNYVDVVTQSNEKCTLAYIISTEELNSTNPSSVYREGNKVDVYDAQILRLSDDLEPSTTYYLYAVYRTDYEYSEVMQLTFTTGEFDCSELLTVLSTQYDGYKMRITVPESTKAAGNAIRWTQYSLMMYNYLVNFNRSNDFQSLLYNASKWATDDITLEYLEENNWYQTDYDSDGDGELDWETNWSPISPGEPVVFFAGEFAWADETYDGSINEVKSCVEGWGNGYYKPLMNDDWYYMYYDDYTTQLDGMDYTRPMDAGWNGAFQRKLFRVKEPAHLNAGVDVEMRDASPFDIILDFYPDDEVYQYSVIVLDDATYEEFMGLINYREEFKQWAVTSYDGFYVFGSRVFNVPVEIKVSSFFYEINADAIYHVLVTSMGDAQGTTQSFKEYTFKTTSKIYPAPVVEVTPVMSETTPFSAAFNVKCTSGADNPLTKAYYAANYVGEWDKLMSDDNSLYDLIENNYSFTAEELYRINSDEGLTLRFPSRDGASTRLAVLGYNSENTANRLPSYEYIDDCPAVATVTTPYYADFYEGEIEQISPSVLNKLVGEWSATATQVRYKYYSDYLTIDSYVKPHPYIVITDNLNDYPQNLSSDVYQMYESNYQYYKAKVDALYDEFKEYAHEYTDKRLAGMNRVLGTGWVGTDPNANRNVRTPYDLFVADDYNSVDVSSMYDDFGPKWYIEAYKDPVTSQVRFRIPLDMNNLPPAANWDGDLYYMSGYDHRTKQAITYSTDSDGLFFPVEYDEENDDLIILPFEYDGLIYYPNLIAFNSYNNVSLYADAVASEIRLSRRGGITKSTGMTDQGASVNVPVNVDAPNFVYKQRTDLVASEPLKTIEYELRTLDQIKAKAEELFRK